MITSIKLIMNFRINYIVKSFPLANEIIKSIASIINSCKRPRTPETEFLFLRVEMSEAVYNIVFSRKFIKIFLYLRINPWNMFIGICIIVV